MGRMAKKSPPRRGAWRAIIYAIFTDELFGQKQNPAGVASGVRCFCGRGGLCGFSDLFARAADDLHGDAVELDSEVDGAALAEQLAAFGVALSECHRGHGLRFLAFLRDSPTGQLGGLVPSLFGARKRGVM